MKVYIGNLPASVTEAGVRRACRRHGTVASVHVARDPGTRRHRGFALVEMPDDAEAKAAMEGLNAEGIAGSAVTANEAPEDVSLLESPTFLSFLTFMGDRPFTPTLEFFSLVAELAASGHLWVTTLDDGAAACVYRHPRLAPWIKGSRFLTMGPLEAALDWNLAMLGAARVLAVEGHRPNYLKCRALKAAFPSLPIDFVEADVSQLQVEPDFDVVICCGVLYHLHEPQILLQKIRASKPRRAFLATQAAVDPPHPAFARYGLGDVAYVLAKGRAYRGRWYPDVRPGPRDYHAGLDGRLSFWFYPEELRRLIEDAGLEVEEFVVKDEGEAGLLVDALLSVP